MVLSKNFEHQLEIGHQGELAIENILQYQDWYTIPTYDYRSQQKKSPRMIGKNKTLLIPDLDASKNGKRIWVECKWKEGASYTYKKKVFEHGIPTYLYKGYLEIEKITGNPIWIFFLEGDQAALTQKEAKKGYNPPSRNEYQKNSLRGQILSQIQNTRMSIMEGKSHVFFPQQELLYFGVVIKNYLFDIDNYNEKPISLSILES